MIQMKCAKWKWRSFSLQIKNDQLPFCLSLCLCVCVAAVTWPWADLLCIVSYCSCDWRAEGGVLLCRLFAVFVFSTCTLHKRKQNDFNAIIHMKSHFETETVWCDFSQLFNCSSAGFFFTHLWCLLLVFSPDRWTMPRSSTMWEQELPFLLECCLCACSRRWLTDWPRPRGSTTWPTSGSAWPCWPLWPWCSVSSPAIDRWQPLGFTVSGDTCSMIKQGDTDTRLQTWQKSASSF